MEHSGDRPIPNSAEDSSSPRTTRQTMSPQAPQTAQPQHPNLSSVRSDLSSLEASRIGLEGFKFRFATDPYTQLQEPHGVKEKITGKIKSIKDSLIERPVPIQLIDERTVAFLILQHQRNNLRGADNKTIQPFNAVDILRDAGYVAINPNTDYESKWPVPYARSTQVLRSLFDNGVIDLIEPDADPTDNPGYKVSKEQASVLMELAKLAKNASNRFDPRTLAPIK